MFTLVFDNENGEAVRDADALNTIIEKITSDQNGTYSTGTSMVIYAARTLIKDGRIPSDSIQFVYEGRVVKHNEFGRLDFWPTGFCDHSEKFLCKLARRKDVTPYPNNPLF